jgi:hypothetical protein
LTFSKALLDEFEFLSLVYILNFESCSPDVDVDVSASKDTQVLQEVLQIEKVRAMEEGENNVDIIVVCVHTHEFKAREE